ncbi:MULTISPECIES: putidacin L1 family lectin-like bacteriocin [Pseudomonas]|mgnify:CR=1 FL=1|jgi:hypothetical protein|uniref:D-mannose binding lectin n=1 Tax=Pseudomonas mandelii TaxID=75612 RepID=A0AB36CPL4_9PSED|nr:MULTISPECIES: putidacin L1 family lectin-like bacteriocin [Pseudomonas]MDO8406703.1 putidacin L1 family lectin-like bacteriocin [Pseudomonas sp.]NMZ78025.1 putidacin L1 family lectin-like bacteriocin [Pseudomonas mandelii]TWS11750.1 putidacin L1 family lectin-like bacteriocin [Pseudomonas mandelii]SDU08371.1 D-mannose binding lectin [Pseudomonas mandelii]
MATLPRYPFTENGSSVLLPLHEMSAGQYLQSPDKRFKMILQPDGNLAIYDGANTVWVAVAGQPYTSGGTKIDNSKIYFYLMYYAFLNDPSRNRMWGTANSTPLNNDIWGAYNRTYLSLQNDGNLVVVDSVPVWASNSAIPISPSIDSVYIAAGTTLEVDRRYVSGGTTLIFQSDGNLVVSNGPLGVLWASWTQNKGATRAVMQEDGNFVIYGVNNTPLWFTGTAGRPGAMAKVQANGSFSIVSEKPVWARFGFTPTILPKRVFNFDNGPWVPIYERPLWTFN